MPGGQLFLKYYLLLFAFLNFVAAEIIDLNGKWDFISENGTVKGIGMVPGDIYMDLYSNGKIPNPLYGFTDVDSRWVSLTNWNYSKTFTIEEKTKAVYVLEFDGLDTVSTVYLNGFPVGKTVNQFVKFTFDITNLIRKGDNEIVVVFESAVTYGKQEDELYMKNFSRTVPLDCPPQMFHGECHGNMVRKIQSSFSWDWGPAFPTMGIWQPARIVVQKTAVIEELNIGLETRDLSFVVTVTVVLSSRATITAVIPELKTTQIIDGEQGVNVILMKFNKNDVELWWPNGYGEQKLYDVEVKLDQGDVHHRRIGFRNIELGQDFVNETDTKQGRQFYFKVNDVPIFLKGSNWIPVSPFPAQNHTERYNFLLESSREVGMNAMRVWGGGRYEDELFYRLADEKGILIWHDLMFACALYPAHEAFLTSVKEELTYNVNRLKHHPSILLWAGNNENELGLHDGWFSSPMKESRKEYLMLYKELAEKLINELDPGRPYLLSSPSNGIETELEGGISSDPGSEFYGDIHFYNEFVNLWSDKNYKTPRCATEYGVQSFPSKSTVLNQINSSDYGYMSEGWSHRQHHPGGLENNLAMIFSHFPIPKECATNSNKNQLDRQCSFLKSPKFMERFSYYSQAHQAIAYKVQTEHYRRFMNQYDSAGRGNTMCALYWQLNDVWAAPTWASIDYDLRWKLAHYEARRFFQPIHTILHLSSGSMETTVVNELPKPAIGTVQLSVYTWDNGLSPVYSATTNVTVPPSSAQPVTFDFLASHREKISTQLEDFVFVGRFFNGNGSQVGHESVVIPDKLFKVNLDQCGDVQIKSVEKISDLEYSVLIETTGISPLTWININKPFTGFFSDNAFTMVEKTKRVTLKLTKPLALATTDFTVCNLKTCGNGVPFL